MQLQLKNLCKQYGTKCAVNHVNASLSPGVYGLLGANGAGKTTLMRMICGVLKPSSGSIRLNGKSIEELGERYYSHLGYMPQDFGFYPDFTAREFMLYMAAVKGLDAKTAKQRTEHLLHMVNLQDVANKKVKSYSGGMKQRLGIAQAELNHPSILILDEPTAGLEGTFPQPHIRFCKRENCYPVHAHRIGCFLYRRLHFDDEKRTILAWRTHGNSYRPYQREGLGNLD